MVVKDIKTALENFETGMMDNKKAFKVALYGDIEKRKEKEVQGLTIIPFGIPEVDRASDVGGIPLGRLVEIYGPESGGKSYLSLKLIASAQKMGLRACLIDAEHCFDPDWAEKHGVNPKELVYGEDFDYGEDALQYVHNLAKSGIVNLIVVDSVTALVPKATAEANFEDSQMGVQARMLSRALPQINDAAAKHNVVVVFINQLREKIGVMFGNPETTPGGRALKFYSSIRIRVSKVKMEFEDDQDGHDGAKKPVYTVSKVKFEKNKVGLPFREGQFELYFDPTRNSPKSQLLVKALELRAISRKTNEAGKMEFVWGKGKDVEFTGAEDNRSMVKWLEVQEKWKDLSDLVTAKATDKGLLDEPLQKLLTEVAALLTPTQNIEKTE